MKITFHDRVKNLLAMSHIRHKQYQIRRQICRTAWSKFLGAPIICTTYIAYYMRTNRWIAFNFEHNVFDMYNRWRTLSRHRQLVSGPKFSALWLTANKLNHGYWLLNANHKITSLGSTCPLTRPGLNTPYSINVYVDFVKSDFFQPNPKRQYP